MALGEPLAAGQGSLFAPLDAAELEARVRAAVLASGRKLVALDDDPTGVQTVADTAVLARWEVADLAAELRQPNPVFYVLTNSRSLPESEAVALNREIVRNLAAASRETGVGVAIASRSDSTLRGHFPAETDVIASEIGGVDGLLLCPAFFEGGRVTIDDVHYLREGDRLIPVNETEFARDATFGYRHANLREWVEEKTGGRARAGEVHSLGLSDIREGGPERIAALLMDVRDGGVVVVNAEDYADLFVVVLGLLRAEAEGRRFIYRTGASFVRARAGLPARPLLTRAEMLGPDAPASTPGLVIVGSHVQRSTEQLRRLLELPDTVGIEVNVPALLGDGANRDAEVQRAWREADAVLRAGKTAVVYTSRRVETAGDPLAAGRAVSAALVDIASGIDTDPGFIVGKGGITSSDIGTKALGARRAIVLGQIRAGVPVWRLGPETRYPGRPYVVFPGNVGTAETLAEVVSVLRGTAGPAA
ncbi:MAG TPA: four-carbon acid sugar kinase family protein [Thermomicrobiales bacterium]